jgi:hypothetical protein
MTAQTGVPPGTCSDSPLIALLNLATEGYLYTTVTAAEIDSHNAKFSVAANDPETEDRLDNTRVQNSSYIAAYRRDVALCDLIQNRRMLRDQKRWWELEFSIKRTDFIPAMEVGFGSTSVDKLAELRARRILLNESPATDSTDINDVTKELFLGGFETVVRVKRSPFPELFSQYGRDSVQFLQIAWIQAVMTLKLAGCVAEINQLKLTLRDGALDVSFKGIRNKRYVNEPSYQILVQGTCAL